MKQKKQLPDAFVEEKDFNAVLAQLLKTGPKPISERKIISNRGRPKTPQARPKKSKS